MPLPYNDYGHWLRSQFPYKVQKISIDAGFSCPNRDGTLSQGGCIFCDNRTFNPSYCNRQKSIREQLQEGKEFFRRKYPDMKYLAYFQAYSNTYAPIETLQKRYEEALECEDVVGIVIGTRPDCIDGPKLSYLQQLSRQVFVTVEYGIESTNDEVLQRINRGHDYACARKAVEETAARGITTAAHLILGLTEEDEKQCETQARQISALPLDILKLHQLQIIKGTPLAMQYQEHPFHLYSVNEFIRLTGIYIAHLRPNIVLERFVSQSPKELLLAPQWGLKNHEFTNLLVNYLKEKGIHQGMYWQKESQQEQ
ncbi:MAG: TIGR01212 family radical SAM protein [Prevotella sp.]